MERWKIVRPLYERFFLELICPVCDRWGAENHNAYTKFTNSKQSMYVPGMFIFVASGNNNHKNRVDARSVTMSTTLNCHGKSGDWVLANRCTVQKFDSHTNFSFSMVFFLLVWIRLTFEHNVCTCYFMLLFGVFFLFLAFDGTAVDYFSLYALCTTPITYV